MIITVTIHPDSGKPATQFTIHPPIAHVLGTAAMPSDSLWAPYYDDGRGNGDHVGEDYSAETPGAVVDKLITLIREN